MSIYDINQIKEELTKKNKHRDQNIRVYAKKLFLI